MGEYSSSSQISRIKPYHATTIPLADVLLSCKKLPRCGRGKEGGVRERERGRGRKEKEVRRRRKRGGSRPTSRRRRGDASKDTAALSLKSTKSRTRKKAKMEGGGGGAKARELWGALNPTLWHVRDFFPLVLHNSRLLLYYNFLSCNPNREAWKLAASAASTRRKIWSATKVPAECFYKKKRFPFPKRH